MQSEENSPIDANRESDQENHSIKILLDLSLAFLVVFLVARVMVSGMNQEPRMPSVNKVIELFPSLALICWILAALTSGKLGFQKTAVRAPILIFMALAVLSVAQASYAFAAAHTAATWVIHISAFFLVVNLGANRKRFNVILVTLVAISIVVAVLAFYQYFYEFGAVREYYERNPSAVMVQENLRGDFVRRLYMDEAYGTFIQSNTFAGFLIMMLPVAAFLAWGMIRRRSEADSGLIVSGLGFCAIAGALYLTGSKGGWLGLVGGAVLFAGFFWLHTRSRERLRKAKLNAAGVVAAFVVLVIALILVVGHEDLPASVRFRLGYWDASLRAIWNNPLGVGLANFQENYTRYQQVWATEVRSPHNSYLGIWSEMSIAGLAAFVMILVTAGRRYMAAFRKGNDRYASEAGAGAAGARYSILALVAGAVGFGLVTVLGRFAEIPFTQTPSVMALATMLWMAMTAGLLLSKKVLNPALASAGLAAGLLAFACHAFIDFDFYSHGINAVFWIMLGLLLSHCCRLEGFKQARARLSRLAVAASILIIAIVMFFGILYLPQSLSADGQAQVARRLAEDAAKTGYEPQFTLGVVEEFKKAQKLSPWNAENYRHAAELHENVFLRTENREVAQKALDAYLNLLELRPNSHNAHFHSGVLSWFASEGSAEGAAAAVASIERAIELYPINASYHYCLGVYLERLASLSEPGNVPRLMGRARASFQKALQLHEQVVYPRGKLLDAQVDEIKYRLGIR